MASKAHQLIAAMIARKMRQEGFDVVMFEGKEHYVSDIQLKMPITLKKHRPDLIGYNLSTKQICIGEAKTKHDLSTKRTKDQIKDFSGIIQHSGLKVKFIIGIPMSSTDKLKRILNEFGLDRAKNIDLVIVPDRLL